MQVICEICVCNAARNSDVQEVARGQALGAHAGTDLTELAGVYGALARGYREEYVMYNLPAAALAQARTLLYCAAHAMSPWQGRRVPCRLCCCAKADCTPES